MKSHLILPLLALLFLGCGKKENETHLLIGMWSDPPHSELSVGAEFGKGKEISNVGVFSDKEFGTIELYFEGKNVGSHKNGSVWMNTSNGHSEIKGNVSEKLIAIQIEEIGTEQFRITKIEEIEPGSVSLSIQKK